MKMCSNLQLCMLLWCVMLLGMACMVVLIRYVLWPRLRRILHCAWCWQDCGIGGEYPPPWSSTMCFYHRHCQRELLAANRQARQVRDAAKPVQEREVVQA